MRPFFGGVFAVSEAVPTLNFAGRVRINLYVEILLMREISHSKGGANIFIDSKSSKRQAITQKAETLCMKYISSADDIFQQQKCVAIFLIFFMGGDRGDVIGKKGKPRDCIIRGGGGAM